MTTRLPLIAEPCAVSLAFIILKHFCLSAVKHGGTGARPAEFGFSQGNKTLMVFVEVTLQNGRLCLKKGF
jgi:hypothetical protein